VKIAVYSDVHANLEAFQAILRDIDRQNVDMKLFLGDIVGYGPNPNECIELLRENSDVVLGGNHDWAAVGFTDDSYFNHYARASMNWTREKLTEENMEYLKTLKPGQLMDDIQLVHATPLEPDQWHYIMSMQDAQVNYPFLEKDLCFIGHSHQPVIIEYLDGTNIMPIRDLYKTLDNNRKYVINVGSVGQPRDSNPDACYLVYEKETRDIQYRRVAYDIKRVQKKMARQKLPQYLIDRIAIGR
jgi:diadenosine tetraphosphatase ApaH/serine/threonine PP2A family protein phosphatase